MYATSISTLWCLYLASISILILWGPGDLLSISTLWGLDIFYPYLLILWLLDVVWLTHRMPRHIFWNRHYPPPPPPPNRGCIVSYYCNRYSKVSPMGTSLCEWQVNRGIVTNFCCSQYWFQRSSRRETIYINSSEVQSRAWSWIGPAIGLNSGWC